MPETSQSPLPGSNLDPTDYLPHSLLRSNTIPPNPTQSPSTIDWLHDFAGHSWIAYGASSLLVISHLPSPLSAVESRLAPFLRLVFHLPSTVSAVSWSPVTPSTGELAAASGHCIFLFSNYSATSTKGSFCWSQNAVLVQSTKVEAIKWAGSGDGLIVGGFDVVLWRRRNKSWEIAWKFKKEQLQTHVSATWSIGGCSASASCPSGVHAKESNNTNTHVMVCYGNGASEFASTELRHPQPVTMIQWRPLIGRQFKVDANLLSQNVLLTCCLDGTVRLWTEVDHGKVRKQGKEHNIDQKAIKRSFSVTAVIEINKALQGALGIDISLAWAIDIDGLCRTRDGISRFFSVEEHGNLRVGRCEWLVGLGPGALITFWAIHCLDDKLPVRFPRVTLWIKQQIQELESEQLHCSGFSKLEDNLLLSKVVILRSCPSAPPTVCSLIRLSRCSYLTRLVLEAETSINTLEKSSNQLKIDRYSASSASNIVNVGHSGEILQVAIHPDNCKVELAVSLDSNGLILFWSISKFADTELGLSTLIPTWENCGEFETRNSCSKYTCLKWAPSVKDNDRILLMGHAGGIDCFIVEICQNKKRMNCHHLCTIPLGHVDTLEDGPSDIFGVPLSSTCNQTFKYNNFMLLGLWSKGFRALSWEVTVHSYDSCGSCSTCSFYDNWAKEGYLWKFENNFSNRRYCLGVNVCSSQLPEPHSSDHVTSYSVISPDNLIPVQENPNFNIDLSCGFPAYVMATGCSDGSLKLWRSNSSKQSTDIPWELVGKFIAFEGPIHSICLAGSGQKIATICAGSHLRGGPSILRIWETLHFIGGGTFMLEDELYIDGDVVACKWLGLGNGQFLLGISLQNELHVYAKKHLDGFALISPVNNRNEQNWSCIAVSRTQSTNRDFVWGPRATAVVIHDNYFSLLSQLLGMVNDENQAKSCLQFVDKDYEVRKQTEPFSCHDDDITVLRESSSQNDLIGNWSIIEVVEKYKGALQVFHPKALIMNICSGNWKRAYVSVKHLVDFLIDASERKSGSEKCNCVPQVALSSYLEGFMQKDSTDKGFHWNADPRLSTSSAVSFIYNSNFDASSSMSGSSATKPEIAKFIDTLEKKYSLVGFDEEEKLQVLAIVDLLGELLHSSSAFQNLDEAGRRFWVKLRFQQLHYSKRFGRLPSVEEMVVDARLINWAFHSDCQETLWSSFLPSEPSWKQMQTLGVGFWFTNVVELRARMEKLARLQYLRKKDPKDCALLYIVLNRLQVLAGLFKLSKDEKDKPLVGFLLRNFQEEKNKAAALKNAYVLLGRHQIELAIAFFLLGGDTYSAVTVCVKNLGDEQLALVICSLIDGPGGSLEHQLITKVMLPSSIARGDYWITALLEWRLGNYYESILKMLGCHGSSAIYRYALSYNHLAFLDPHIGLYCLLLATKTSVKNAIGESAAAILGRWATVMAARAFASCGLFLEALECASSRTIPVSMDQRTFFSNNHSQILRDILKPTALDSFNWLSGDVALHLESFAKTDLALQYFSLLMKEHPRWYDTVASSSGYGTSYTDFGIQQDLKLVENFREKIRQGLANLEKFSVPSSHITQMMLIWLCNNGLCFLGYDITLDYSSHNSSLDIGLAVGGHILYPYQFKQVWKAVQDTYLLWSRFTISSCLSCFILSYKENDKDVSVELQAICSYNWNRYVQDILGVFSRLRASMRIIFSSLSEDISRILSILDLFEFYVHVASAWHLRDSEELLSVVQPFLINCTNGQTPYKVDLEKLKEIICQPKQLLGCQNSKDDARTRNNIIGYVLDSQDGHKTPSSADNEKWHVIGTCVWQRMEKLMKQVFHSFSINLEDSCLPDPSNNTISSLFSIPADAGGKSIKEQIEFFTMLLADLFKTTTMYISSYHLKMLGSFVQWKVVNGLQTPILEWLRESSVAHAKTPNQDASRGTVKSEDEKIVEILWNTCANPVLVSEGFAEEKISWSHLVDRKSSKSWNEIYKSMTAENKTEESIDNEVTISKNSLSNEDQTTSKGLFKNTRTFLSSWQKDVVNSKEDSQFEIAKEIYKGEGELLAALCINSTNEQEGAIASSRKGIIFFSWEDWQPCRDQSNYIWSYADWPLNGWAGTQSTPVPTCVSPGVGLGSKKGAHLGLGGATIGVDSSARPFRDLTSGGAFGIPGYAGIGASGLGWEVQDDFEEFIDPPATVENINTRAFSSHPSRPFFLVGSSNTHIYLWEFGKDRATATYGVLPAANVPPPYALASISALQFDHYGHRFATAALDGTVCTWQLEVGGRSNIHPTESSLCFNDHASDVTYIISSGSIIAAAGSSSNNLNVVIWDTLASATTSRIPIRCHEGGARSIAVFDNNIGSGSVSPLIVTGGKGGDVAVHDFRYVVTGKTKRLKHSGSSNGGGSSSSSNADMQTKVGISGEKNVDGMLWYLPKAHLGSVTKVATIPHTSLFLTGSKDGDVKLWDAKAAKMVWHWPKLHERRTFLEPNTRGFGGVVRAAVTDIQVISHGFLTCGADGSVKLVKLRDRSGTVP